MADFPGIPTKHLPIKVERGTSMPPSDKTDVVSMLAHHAKRWSPVGIVAALVLGFFLVGEDRIVRVARAFSANEETLTEMKALRADLAIEREERGKVLARLYATERNLSALCDFTAKINGQRPNKSWCSNDGRALAFGTLVSTSGEQTLTTEYAWIYPE